MHDSPYWTQFLNARTEEDLNELRNLNDPVIDQALQIIDARKVDPEIQNMVHMRDYIMNEETRAPVNTENPKVETAEHCMASEQPEDLGDDLENELLNGLVDELTNHIVQDLEEKLEGGLADELVEEFTKSMNAGEELNLTTLQEQILNQLMSMGIPEDTIMKSISLDPLIEQQIERVDD